METQLSQGGPIKDKNLDELWGKVSGSWKARLVLLLVEREDLRKDVRDIAKVAQISLDETFEALDMLIATGLIKKLADGTYQKTTDNVIFSQKQLNPTNELRNFSMIASEVISRLSPSGPCRYESSFVHTNKENLNTFISDLKMAFEKFLDNSSKSNEKNMIVGWQSSLTDMLNTKPRSGGSQ